MTFLTVTMDDDNDMTTNVGGSRGSKARNGTLLRVRVFKVRSVLECYSYLFNTKSVEECGSSIHCVFPQSSSILLRSY